VKEVGLKTRVNSEEAIDGESGESVEKEDVTGVGTGE